MDDFLRLISILGTVSTLGATALVLFALRKERRIGAWSLLLSAVLILLVLIVFVALSGARLRLVLAVPLLILGMLVGLVRGATTRLTWRGKQVIGRDSWVFTLGWGGSLALAQALTLFNSALLASVGLIPVLLSSGAQMGMNVDLFLRRLMMRTPPSSTSPHSPQKPGRVTPRGPR